MENGGIVTEDNAIPSLFGSGERCDFFYRIRDTTEISKWRSQLIDRVMREYRTRDLPRVRTMVDLGIVLLREIGRTLALIYGDPETTRDETRASPDPHAERVLKRLQPYRGFGCKTQDSDKFVGSVSDFLPPNFRVLLCESLSAHGQNVCREDDALCDKCAIRNFCSTYRRAEAARQEGSGAPTVVDLFAGAGGSSEGFRRAGFRVILAVDRDPIALRTYWLNHPGLADDRICECDVRERKPGSLRRLVGGGKVDVLIGSPPCQGFSHAGFRARRTRTDYRVSSDERNYLFESMISAASELRPKLFLMENVPGMHSARQQNLSFIEHAGRILEQKCRYSTAIWRLNASAFGVPQDRIRYFLVASTGAMPPQPEEEYQDTSRRDFDVDALPPITFGEAVFDLPQRKAGVGCAIDCWNPGQSSANSRYRRYLAKFSLIRNIPVIYNHAARPHNERDLQLYSTLRPGENSVHAVEKYGRQDLMRYRRDIFDDKYARLREDRPSKTIVSHLAKDGNGYIHPSQVRSITVREAARVQSFHDEYAFCGSVSHQWTQVGNAVPPLLAEAIARSFMRVLKKSNGHK
jgi:DNA (cytosine-5)-methyltransferase 1